MVLSKDKKIAICFGLIIGALFSFCGLCFADELEPVTFSNVANTNFSSDKTVIIESSSATGIGYFQIEPGYKYYLINNSTTSDKEIAFSPDIPAPGVSIDYIGTLTKNGGTYEFNGSSYGYLYFDFYSFSSQVVCTREPMDGIDGFIDVLITSISTEGLWSTFLDCVPLLVLAVLWGLGFFLIVRLVIGIVKAKGGV